MSGLEIPLIKISNQNKDEPAIRKPVIFIVGRVHPYETYTSFVIHGLLNHLLSQDALVHKLRDHYEI